MAMGRHELREQVFLLLFRLEFNSPEDMPEQMKLFFEGDDYTRLEQDVDYITDKYQHVRDMIPKLDRMINENTEGWDTSRLGKVELTVLRLGVYELCFDDDIPENVAIDEAIEIAKKYGQDASGGFVNAILNKIKKLGE